MNFKDTHTNEERRYSLGQELSSNKYYLSIPVSNRMVDYEEYYEISKEFYDSYPENIVQVNSFAQDCKKRNNDSLLIIKPGRDRGVA